MRAHHIMTRKVITVKADTTIRDAANLMLQQHISGLPVVDEAGGLIGMVSEGDFIRRSEIGTQRPHIGWLDFLMSGDKGALDFVREHGRKVGEIMTRDEIHSATEDMLLEELVRLMERHEVCENDGMDAARHGVNNVARYLARHRIRAEARAEVQSKGSSGADQIIAFAEDEGSDLLVTGAYGHSRFNEWVFGGMTRDLLTSSPIRCLMSH